MSRNGSGVYSLPSVYEVAAGDTIEPAQHNTPLEDLETDANTARPISVGGTGATTVASARSNLDVYSTSEVDAAIAAPFPASAVDGNFVAFNGTTGAVLKDSGKKPADFATAAQGTKADGATQATDLASTAASKGASLVGVQDSAGNYTGTTVETVLAEIATSIAARAGFYSGTTAGTTNFPVGQILAITNVSTTAPDRMGTCTPALHNTDTKRYVLSGDVNAGTSLSGTWHSIGYDSGANILWVQRTA